MAEPWLIRFFACNREMQPFSFFFDGYSLGGGRALNLTVPLGSGWVRQSRVRAGFGLQFWARADLYAEHTYVTTKDIRQVASTPSASFLIQQNNNFFIAGAAGAWNIHVFFVWFWQARKYLLSSSE